MIEKFRFWLYSIVEQTPIPDEIENILFTLTIDEHGSFLKMEGFEKEINLNILCFRPLEAEFFAMGGYKHKNKDVIIYNVKEIIDESFSDNFLKEQFKKRKIYFMCNQKLEYLFKI